MSRASKEIAQLKTLAGIVAVLGVVGGAYWVYSKRRALATAVNPVDRQNVFYQGSGEIGTKVPDWFGGLFKSDAERKVDKMLANPAPGTQETTVATTRNSWEIIH